MKSRFTINIISKSPIKIATKVSSNRLVRVNPKTFVFVKQDSALV